MDILETINGYLADYLHRVACAARRRRRLLSHASAIAAPAVNIQSAATGNQSIFRMATGSSARIPACLLHDELAGERGPDKTLDGP
jgi:hypothetical protein